MAIVTPFELTEPFSTDTFNLRISAINANILKSATKELYGLDESSGPDDVFAWIGKYNQHWWAVKTPEVYGYVRKENTFDYPPFLKYGSENYSVKYSSEISINQDTGAITLVNPQSLSMPSGSSRADCQTVASNLLAVTPCYITGCGIGSYSGDNSTNIYYIPADATSGSSRDSTIVATTQGNSKWSCFISEYSAATPPAKLITTEHKKIHEAGETIYYQSSDRNAYPDSGTVDGLTYQYLGVPFQKFPTMPQIATGSYTGTGTYGSSNPNSLMFDFNPKLIIIGNVASYNGVPMHVIFQKDSDFAIFYASMHVTWSDSGVSWYSSDSANYQLNKSGAQYYYTAIG